MGQDSTNRERDEVSTRRQRTGESDRAPTQDGLVDEVLGLREECAEAYHVIAFLAERAGLSNHPDTVKALENLAAAANGEPRPHADFLLFVR
jgi:hypothetical protein